MATQHDDRPDFTPYPGPSGGWGSLKSVAEIVPREKNPVETSKELLRQNKPGGFMCVSCAWAKPHPPHPAEFCENGAKATAWEITSQRVTPDFFREHTLTALRDWSDYRLEEAGHGAAAIARIHAPVGLDIGAVTAPEIALSIVAQVVAARRGKLGGGTPG